MGKAGKWIRNFLMGKREDTSKKTGHSVSSTDARKVRRGWSLKRSSSTARRSSASFDWLPTLNQGDNTKIQGMESALNAHDAATKIQAIYRSYLAKRALRALKGLVKLQALARGYLVRKQMNTVVRSVHAVMKIQVRARIHRIQMAEEPQVIERQRKSYRESSANENTADSKSFRVIGGLRSRSTRAECIPSQGDECSWKIDSPASQKDSKLHSLASPSTVSFTDSTSTTYDGTQEEFSLKKARQNSGRYFYCPENKHSIIRLPTHCPDYNIPRSSNFTPNYMNNTESSKAKARSHSEPRQRPESNTKQRSRRSSSIDGKNDQENQYPWLLKLWRTGKFTTDRERESYITTVASIYKRNSFVPFEPPMNLN
ncbi:protein IQ-DOMAIN 19-like isoform X2 [Andrographis paniculata]|uniref:protein IQ-DOMAIN 19-like isoform X2 n=1 Tax=Andrographis paniculata TaxID=175694 RepID=UPI0021E8ACC5|nr:protein IQ-DOMAIN 19-like isoform X2 [Andrographis paniculata]